jgi:UPF0271 protein
MALRVDINADIGGSYGRWRLGDDEAVIPHVTSVNVCCGYHAGDPHVMRAAVALAVRHGVGIGAHVAFPDLLGYGRRRMQVAPQDLRDYTVYQIGALLGFAQAAGTRLQHVKPHGAMYVMASEDDAYARAVVEAAAEVDSRLIMVLRGDAVANAARAVGLRFASEGYVDVDYAADGSLVLTGAGRSLTPERVAARAVRMVKDGKVEAVDGSELDIRVMTICVHGDRPNAALTARTIRKRLTASGVDVVPLAVLTA